MYDPKICAHIYLNHAFSDVDILSVSYRHKPGCFCEGKATEKYERDGDGRVEMTSRCCSTKRNGKQDTHGVSAANGKQCC